MKKILNIIFIFMKIISYLWIVLWGLVSCIVSFTDGQNHLGQRILMFILLDIIPIGFLIWRFNADKKIRVEKRKHKLEAKKEEIRVKEELNLIEKQENKLVKEEIEARNIREKEEEKKAIISKTYSDNKRVFSFEGLGVKSKVTLDNNWLSIQRDGFHNTVNYGRHGVKKLQIQDISGVQFKEAKNINGGYIELILKSYDKNVNKGLGKLDENTIMFTKQDNDLAKELVRVIESKIEDIRISNNGATIINQNTQTTAEEIRAFKELLDQGIITEEEFNKKKSQLLNI